MLLEIVSARPISRRGRPWSRPSAPSSSSAESSTCSAATPDRDTAEIRRVMDANAFGPCQIAAVPIRLERLHPLRPARARENLRIRGSRDKPQNREEENQFDTRSFSSPSYAVVKKNLCS